MVLKELRRYLTDCLLSYEQVFEKMLFEIESNLLPIQLFTNNLRSFGILRYIQSQVKKDDDVRVVFNRFAERFSNENSIVTEERWNYLVDPPAHDLFEAMRKAATRTREGFKLLGAKFRLLDSCNTGVVAKNDFVEVLHDTFHNEFITREEIDTLADKLLLDANESIDYHRFVADLDILGPKEQNSGPENLEIRSNSDDGEIMHEEKQQQNVQIDNTILVDPDEEELFGREFMANETFQKALSEIRYICLLSADPNNTGNYDLDRPFREFDQSNNGTIDIEEFKKALKRIGIKDIIREEEDLEKFLSHLVRSKSNTLDFNDFKRLVGYKRPSFKHAPKPLVVRWAIEVYFHDDSRWRKGIVTRYREIDRSVLITLQPFGIYPEQIIGYTSLIECPIVLRKNLWSSKPWGRDPLFQKLYKRNQSNNNYL
eukprot:CAMPEP_0204822542 /NCGR_PEP_ID=MMETSP1346-20131115/737_1 /ASSEMBLY_ACC=CAM_ASM_000771 /TAXON_ID=215587 /ORGANISM="Aplanochytrium stocchinoi, Strain GSBS06" /LENGTH=427 /DNA_ID=CAMNT_0051948805 /DNA_START=655 /DNA_END=1938 /DNA_ORIENTATION=+